MDISILKFMQCQAFKKTDGNISQYSVSLAEDAILLHGESTQRKIQIPIRDISISGQTADSILFSATLPVQVLDNSAQSPRTEKYEVVFIDYDSSIDT